MNCDHVQNQLLGLERPQEPPPPIAAHLVDCAPCRAWQQQLLQLEQSMSLLPVPNSSAARASLVQRIRSSDFREAAKNGKALEDLESQPKTSLPGEDLPSNLRTPTESQAVKPKNPVAPTSNGRSFPKPPGAPFRKDDKERIASAPKHGKDRQKPTVTPASAKANRSRSSVALILGSWIFDSMTPPRRRVGAGLIVGAAASILLFAIGWLGWYVSREHPTERQLAKKNLGEDGGFLLIQVLLQHGGGDLRLQRALLLRHDVSHQTHIHNAIPSVPALTLGGKR